MKRLLFELIMLVTVCGVSAAVLNVPADVASIQEGINTANTGDTVLVAEGTYYENLNFNGQNFVVKSVSGPASTIIDGSSNGTVVLFMNGESRDAVLEGFTIQNGSGFENTTSTTFGGGICIRFTSSPCLKDLIVKDNHAWGTESSGGGIGISTNSAPLLENVVISDNESYHGGGLYSYFAAPTLINVTIKNNQALASGGGAAFHSSTPVIERILVYNNEAAVGGLGGGGGGLWFHLESNAVVNRATIYGNTSHDVTYGGGGILTSSNNLVWVVNSICYANEPSQIESFVTGTYTPGQIGVAYSDVQDGENGIILQPDELFYYGDNLDLDPGFANATLENFRLNSNSPCIDAGIDVFIYDSETLLTIPLSNYLGNAPDMGVLESPYIVGVDKNDPLQQPDQVRLLPNYPNPFNPSTRIRFNLDHSREISLEIFDLQGGHVQSLFNGTLGQGSHELIWEGTDAQGNAQGSGLYICRLTTDQSTFNQKMTLLR